MKTVLITAFEAAPRGTQSRIADELGVRATAVNKWAKGYNVPEQKHWAKLEQLLDLPAGQLTGLTRSDGGTDPAPSEVMALLHQLAERLDVVESKLGLSAPARSDPSGQVGAEPRPLRLST